MFKLFNSTSFYKDQEEAQVTLLDLSKPEGGLEKKAAHEDIQDYVSKLEPKPGYT